MLRYVVAIGHGIPYPISTRFPADMVNTISERSVELSARRNFMTKQELFNKADQYKKIIQAARPLKPEEIKKLDAYFKIGLTYSSNALEGNTLTISETKVLLEDGLTAGGKPLKDSLEAIGHAKAYDFMLQMVREKPFEITEHIILELHRLFYEGIDKQNTGKYRDISVYITGTDYLPPEPEQVPQLMKEYVHKVNQLSGKVHPIELAALAHKWLVDIHPYVDGNGRTARLLMNLLLMHDGYGIVSIPPVLRVEYIDALRVSQRANQPDAEPFIKLIAECTIETQKDYCRLLRIKAN